MSRKPNHVSGGLALLAMALASSREVRQEPIEIEYKKLPDLPYNFIGFFPAKPSKFIPSKENQPWKRNRR